jgi:DNA-binding transcriptional LysR family regulator
VSLLAGVQRGELDAAITGLPDAARPPPGVTVTELATDPLVVAVGPDHPLAGEPGIPLTRLRGEPMVTLVGDSSQRAHIERACRAAGFEPRITAETMRLSLLWELVSQGLGIAVVPRSSPGSGTRVTLVPITRPRLSVRVVLASGKTTPSPAARAFLGLVSPPAQAHGRAAADPTRSKVKTSRGWEAAAGASG